MIREAIATLVDRRDLTEAEASACMVELMSGEATPAQIAAFLVALRMKGETVDEITGLARVMREKSLRGGSIEQIRGVLEPARQTVGAGPDAELEIELGAGFIGLDEVQTQLRKLCAECRQVVSQALGESVRLQQIDRWHAGKVLPDPEGLARSSRSPEKDRVIPEIRQGENPFESVPHEGDAAAYP